MKKILITGGAGYIGSHITELLIKKKYEVFIIDNLSTGFKKLINKKAIFFKIDLKEKAKIRSLILKYSIDSVIHLAALLDVNESQKKPIKYFQNNVIGTKNLLKASLNSKVKNFIFSSTAAVYKDGIFKVNEKSPTKPKSNYGKGKLKAEKLIQSTFQNTNINYAILRYFNVCGSSKSNKFGQINSYDLLFKNLARNSLKKKPYINIYGNNYKTKDGTCIRDFIHVSDLTDIHFKILKKIHQSNKSILINCGYGSGRSVLDVVMEFQKVLKKKIMIIYKPRRKADLSQIIANNSKLKKFLKWRPNYNNLKTMVKSSVKWERKLS
jgi:UDP-glucose 4-epimerase